MLGLTQLKVFADGKLNVAKKMISVFDRVENIMRQGENAAYLYILFFSLYCFQNLSVS